MGEAENGSLVKERLKSLCVSNGWSYGVLWRFDQRNSMLLTMGDAYCEEHMAAVLGNMLPQVHMLGEGIVGRTAFTGKHQWMHSDAYTGQWNSCIPIESPRDLFQDDSEFRCQFSSGIKTITTISVESGVIQFGSTEKIMERLEFLDETKRVFQELKNLHGHNPLTNVPSTLNTESNDLNELFASLISSVNFHGDITNMFGDKSKDLGGSNLSAINLQSTTSDDIGSAEKTPWFSTQSTKSSLLPSYDPRLSSDIGVQDSLKNCGNVAAPNAQMDSTPTQGSYGYQMDDQQYLHGYPVELNAADFTSGLSKPFMDDLSHWFAASPEQNINRLPTTMTGDLSQVLESTSVSSSLVKGDIFIDVPIEHPATSMQSSITHAFSADGYEKSGIISSAGNNMYQGLGPNYGCGQVRDCWEDSVVPVVSGGCVAAGASEVGSAAVPRRGLFSELGLEELLNGMNTTSISVTKCSLEDQSSTRKRKLESSSVGSNQGQLARVAGAGGSMHLTGPLYNLDKNCLVPKNEALPKSQVGLWIDDSYSVNARGSAQATPQKAEDHTKTAKKRAKPGESTRPRPKDRQQIQDRMKDLRGMIPNGSKCSIDALLDRTIKYMIFLQGVTKHADKLKQPHEPKLTTTENGTVLKDHSSRSGGNNTRALAVEGQTVVCPILVEDLSTPGQMVIEILCEECRFFLEIADEIRGFGLNILKGVMENRGDKIWARFTVEATRHITRIDVFWSLVRLLQQSGSSVVDSTKNVVDNGFPLLDSFQPHSFPLPIGLT